MNLLIVDSQSSGRDSLLGLCACKNDVQVVGEAACGRAAIDAVETLEPGHRALGRGIAGHVGLRTIARAGDRTPVRSASWCRAAPITRPGPSTKVPLITSWCRWLQSDSTGRWCALGVGSNHAFTSLVPVPRFVVGERQRKLYPLDPKSIDYIEADGNYVTLRAGKVEYLRRDSIKGLSMQLGRFGFIRIGRSLLVNAAAVSYAEVAGHGAFALR